jgi:hypothetical protein
MSPRLVYRLAFLTGAAALAAFAATGHAWFLVPAFIGGAAAVALLPE